MIFSPLLSRCLAPFPFSFSFWFAYSHPRCSSRESRGPDRDSLHNALNAGRQGVEQVPVRIAERAGCEYTAKTELSTGQNKRQRPFSRHRHYIDCSKVCPSISFNRCSKSGICDLICASSCRHFSSCRIKSGPCSLRKPWTAR